SAEVDCGRYRANTDDCPPCEGLGGGDPHAESIVVSSGRLLSLQHPAARALLQKLAYRRREDSRARRTSVRGFYFLLCRSDHLAHDIPHSGAGHPAEPLAPLGWIGSTDCQISRAQQSRIAFHVLAPIEAHEAECFGDEVLQAVGFPGGDDVIVGGFLLKHPPHGVHIFRCPTPVPLYGKIAQLEFFLLTYGDPAGRMRNLLRDETFGTQRRFVVEQNPRAGVQAVSLAVISHLPECRSLCYGVGAARTERGVFV